MDSRTKVPSRSALPTRSSTSPNTGMRQAARMTSWPRFLLTTFMIGLLSIYLAMRQYCPHARDVCQTEGQRIPLESLVKKQASRQKWSGNSTLADPNPSIRHRTLQELQSVEQHEQRRHKKNQQLSTDIPMVIYQTYNSRDLIPKKVDKNFRQFAPKYERIIFDDADCLAFLEEHYHPAVIEAFQKLSGPHKADLFRYALLYLYGGVYLDIKTELLVPLDQIFPPKSTSTHMMAYSALTTLGREKTPAIYQGVLATPGGNPVFLRAVQHLVEEKKPLLEYLSVVKKFYGIIADYTQQSRLKPGLNSAPVPVPVKDRQAVHSAQSTISQGNLQSVDTDSDHRHSHGRNDTASKHRKFDFYLLREEAVPVSECHDGPDKYGGCFFIFDKERKVIKSRYADYPWHSRPKKPPAIVLFDVFDSIKPVCRAVGWYKFCDSKR
jgi:Glycosyltransferase sugar-binding region containing DXD motif